MRVAFMRRAGGIARGALFGGLIASFCLPVWGEVRCWDPPTGIHVCDSYLPGGLTGVRAVQRMDQWCWAASISMVFAYYGHPVSQERIVAEAYGRIVGMPAQPWTMLQSLNREWEDDRGRTFRCDSSSGMTDVVSAARDLADEKPLIIGTHGHAVVLTGLEYWAPWVRGPYGPTTGNVAINLAQVQDPWPGRGQRNLSASEWRDINFAVQIRIR